MRSRFIAAASPIKSCLSLPNEILLERNHALNASAAFLSTLTLLSVLQYMKMSFASIWGCAVLYFSDKHVIVQLLF